MNIREKREWYPGAIYHVTDRGVRRQPIFLNEMDFNAFYEIMKKGLEEYQCSLHAYCLMTNHLHMLLETGEIEIWKFMKQVAGNYASYFNQKYIYTGHVFEGRYGSRIIKDEAHFLQVSRYIHLNPVKANIVDFAEQYPWSSYRTIMGYEDDKITKTEQTLSFFQERGREGYRQFVEQADYKCRIQENEIQKKQSVLY